jgi:hypothetical protein
MMPSQISNESISNKIMGMRHYAQANKTLESIDNCGVAVSVSEHSPLCLSFFRQSNVIKSTPAFTSIQETNFD